MILVADNIEYVIHIRHDTWNDTILNRTPSVYINSHIHLPTSSRVAHYDISQWDRKIRDHSVT